MSDVFEKGAKTLLLRSFFLNPDSKLNLDDFFKKNGTNVDEVFGEFMAYANKYKLRSDLYFQKIKNVQDLESRLNSALNKMKSMSLDEKKVTELSDRLYEICVNCLTKEEYKVLQSDDSDKRYQVLDKVLSKMSAEFKIAKPKLIPFYGRKDFCFQGISFGNTIMFNNADGPGIIGLLVHEFTHTLQRNYKSSISPDVSDIEYANYITLSDIGPGLKAELNISDDVYNRLRTTANTIYHASLHEQEAGIGGDVRRKLAMHFRGNDQPVKNIGIVR